MMLAEVDVIEKIKCNLWKITPQLTTIVLTTIIVCLICIIYNIKCRNYLKDQSKQMPGLLVMVESIIKDIENIITTSLGKKYVKLTPYALYIVTYIFVSALLSMFGFEPQTSSYTVTFAMGLVTFFGIYYFGLKYHKFGFFKKYINPVELLTQFVPLISISFRLFGNMLGGAIILGLVYSFSIGLTGTIFAGGSATEQIWSHENLKQNWWHGFNFGSITLIPFMHLYFDLFDGALQAFIFLSLTLAYWGQEVKIEEEQAFENKEESKRDSKRFTINNCINLQKQKEIKKC